MNVIILLQVASLVSATLVLAVILWIGPFFEQLPRVRNILSYVENTPNCLWSLKGSRMRHIHCLDRSHTHPGFSKLYYFKNVCGQNTASLHTSSRETQQRVEADKAWFEHDISICRIICFICTFLEISFSFISQKNETSRH